MTTTAHRPESGTSTSPATAHRPEGGTSTSPTARQLWTRGRGILLVLAVLVVAGIVMAAARSGNNGPLDPRSPSAGGAKAVAEVLGDHGVETRTVTTLDDATSAMGPDTTLLVAVPDLLTETQAGSLRDAATATGSNLVLLAPEVSTGPLAPGVAADTTPAFEDTAEPSCALPAAEQAGDAETTGVRYRVTAQKADSCYLSDGLPTLVRLPSDAPTKTGGDTVVVGSPAFLTNERLAEHGNASLALGLLGSRPDLVWYIPSLADVAEADQDGMSQVGSLLPASWQWAALQLLIAAAAAAFWRGRRFGPLVAEPLPVVVRASETTEGRARLYHAAKARDRAAEALRGATRLRLAPLTGVPVARAHTAEALLPAVAARIGDPTRAAALQELLFGPPPGDDAALVSLADRLDALEREVSRP
ncbi:DUF4350 domain-containing protein [Streptomyces sp. NPDC002734]|uniref:DUF4350 domain-containing protein n=1 Tax=Streptomyces sp. NPDC002734 TaxID=3154426 RepID=UPI00332F7B05